MEIKRVSVTTFALLTVNAEFEYLKENASTPFAYKFRDKFIEHVELLTSNYLHYPECRFLPTKGKIYRNVIWRDYLLIYKILKSEILVLGVFHARQNPRKLKSYRRIK